MIRLVLRLLLLATLAYPMGASGITESEVSWNILDLSRQARDGSGVHIFRRGYQKFFDTIDWSAIARETELRSFANLPFQGYHLYDETREQFHVVPVTHMVYYIKVPQATDRLHLASGNPYGKTQMALVPIDAERLEPQGPSIAAERVPSSRYEVFRFGLVPAGLYALSVHDKGLGKTALYSWMDESAYTSKLMAEYFLVGAHLFCILALMLFNIFLFVTFRKREYFFYILYLFLVCAGTITILGWVPRILLESCDPHNVPQLADMSRLSLQLASVLPMASLVAFLLFVSEFTGLRDYSKRLHRILMIACGLMVLYFSTMPFLGDVGAAILMSRFATVAASTFLIVYSLRRILQRDMNSVFFLLAFIWLIVGSLVTVVSFEILEHRFTYRFYSVFTGSALAAILLSISLGLKMRRMELKQNQQILDLNHSLHEKNEMLTRFNLELESMVEEKTTHIRSILASLRQGIMIATLDKERLVLSPNYSHYLKEILAREPMEGGDLEDLLFKRLDISPAERTMLSSILFAGLDKPKEFWELNSSHLPRQAAFNDHKGQKKFLEIDFEPIADKDGLVASVLLSLRDVTQLRKAEASAQENILLVTRLVELVRMQERDFFALRNQAIAGVEALMQLPLQEFRGHHYPVIMRQLHTLKGLSRSVGLKEVVTLFHELENLVQDLNPAEARPMDQTDIRHRIQGTCHQLLKTVEDLYEIARAYLKWQMDKNTVDIAISRLETWELTLEQAFSRRDWLNLWEAGLHRDIRSTHRKTLKSLLEEHWLAVESLARRLGKKTPQLITTDGVFLSRRGEKHLPEILVHLLNNSLDHGIEDPDERLAKHKPEHGTLWFEANGNQLLVRDDGRGLDLDLIVAKAREQGLGEGLTEQRDLVELFLFSAGASTREGLTEVSGRGIGLYAVKANLEVWGGSIQMQWAPESGSGPRQVFQLRIELPQDFLLDDIAKPASFMTTASA